MCVVKSKRVQLSRELNELVAFIAYFLVRDKHALIPAVSHGSHVVCVVKSKHSLQFRSP